MIAGEAGISSNSIPVTTKCEFYNSTQCNSTKGANCSSVEECQTPEDDKRSHCYVLWTPGENGKPNIFLKGCFLNYEACYDKTDCVEKTPRKTTGKQHMFCCCEGDMCNKNFTWDPAPTTEAPPSSSEYFIVLNFGHNNLYL